MSMNLKSFLKMFLLHFIGWNKSAAPAGAGQTRSQEAESPGAGIH